MATTAERVAKHRKNTDNKRLELVLPVTTCTRYKTALASAVKSGTVTGNAQFIELLLDRYMLEGVTGNTPAVTSEPVADVTGNTQQLTGKAYAVFLLEANNRNATASRTQLVQQLQQQYPGWSPDCGKHKAGTAYHQPQKIYNGVVKHLRG